MRYQHIKSTTLLELNVINQDAIDKYIQGMIAKKELVNQIEVSNWLKKNIKNYIINSNDLNKLTTVKVTAATPEWLKQATERGDALYKFTPTTEFTEELEHIIDWMVSPQGQRERSSFYKITFEQARVHTEKWLKSLMRGEAVEDEAGVVTVEKFKNGWRMVQCTSAQALDREGKLMGHCVGTYADRLTRGLQIYSLRDTNNEPHVTIEVTNNEIRQIKGKENKAPIAKYVPPVKAWVMRSGLKLSTDDQRNLGLVTIDKKPYDLYKLPDHLEVKQDINWKGLPVTKLPAVMICHGNVDMSMCTALREIPPGFKMTGDYRSGELNLAGSGIIKLPAGLTVPGGLVLTACPIAQLPAGLKVGLDFVIGESNITEIPDDFQFNPPAKLGIPSMLTTSKGQLKKYPAALQDNIMEFEFNKK